jgi:hypothetical protein
MLLHGTTNANSYLYSGQRAAPGGALERAGNYTGTPTGRALDGIQV